LTVTRQSLCTVDWCARPTDPDYHVCAVCGALAVQHAHVESRSHNPSRRKDKKNQVMLCVPHHQEVDLRQNGTHGHAIREIPGRGRLYFRFDLHGKILFERILVPCETSESNENIDALASEQRSLVSQAGEEEPIAPLLSSPSSTALMDGEGESEASASGLMRLESTVLSPARGESLPRPPSPSSLFSRESWLSEGERLLTMGLQLKGMTDEWRFEIGDWVASGEQHLGEEAYGHFARFEDAFGASYLRGLGWVAASVSRETRQLCPSWSHARAVAALPESTQREILTAARDEGLSSRQVSALVRPMPAERERHACPLCKHEHYVVVESEWKT